MSDSRRQVPTDLIPPTFLFRFSIPCHRAADLARPEKMELGDQYLLPQLGELDGARTFGELRAAWNEEGLAFQLRVRGKRQTVWCRESAPTDSDGLQLLIDTRDTKTVHRGTRFQHRYLFMPAGGGGGYERPVAAWLPIEQAREHPVRPSAGSVKLHREQRIDGYLLNIFIGGAALTGWDPAEQRRIGFYYLLRDRELGGQTLAYGLDLPFLSDPSLWGTLELLDE